MNEHGTVWAIVPTGRVVALPSELSKVVEQRGPDPLRWRLLDSADAHQRALFASWRERCGARRQLGSSEAGAVVNAVLVRAGQCELRSGRTYDVAAITHLWLLAQEAGLAHPQVKEFVENLGRVVALCIREGRHVLLEVEADRSPTPLAGSTR